MEYKNYPTWNRTMKNNTHNIILTVNEIGLNRFKKVPTFKNLLHPNQLNDLKVGDNKLTVNNTIWGKLQQVTGYDKDNMSVKKDNTVKLKEAYKTYGKDYILNHSKKITKLVSDYLKQGKITDDEILHNKFSGLINYINRNLPVGNTIHNIQQKYGSFDTYLTYLIHYLKKDNVKENVIVNDKNIDKIKDKFTPPQSSIDEMTTTAAGGEYSTPFFIGEVPNEVIETFGYKVVKGQKKPKKTPLKERTNNDNEVFKQFAKLPFEVKDVIFQQLEKDKFKFSPIPTIGDLKKVLPSVKTKIPINWYKFIMDNMYPIPPNIPSNHKKVSVLGQQRENYLIKSAKAFAKKGMLKESKQYLQTLLTEKIMTIDDLQRITNKLNVPFDINDIMKKHNNVSKEEIHNAFIKGTKVEMEHTKDPIIAYTIASHHLMEDPTYYDKLEKCVE